MTLDIRSPTQPRCDYQLCGCGCGTWSRGPYRLGHKPIDRSRLGATSEVSDRLRDQFWARVDRSGLQCWPWLGFVNGKGLPLYHAKSRGKTYAARLSWVIHYGAIPDGLWVLHHCDNPRCVRPDHLFLGTHEDNMADMKAKRRGRNQFSSRAAPPEGHDA